MMRSYVDYKNITKVIAPGKVIFVDDGILAFDVLEIVDSKTVKARARNNGFSKASQSAKVPRED